MIQTIKTALAQDDSKYSTLQASFSGILPPNSAVIGYVTEVARLISAHLFTEITASLLAPSVKFAKCLSRAETVEATQLNVEACTRNIGRVYPRFKNSFKRLDLNDFVFVCAGLSIVNS